MSDPQKLTIRREDVDALEDAADTLMRRAEDELATRLYALALRLRTEAGWDARVHNPHSLQANRYRIRRVPFIISEYDSATPPYGLWDTEDHCYVDKWGRPDPDYWAASREVAIMRRRDLNEMVRRG